MISAFAPKSQLGLFSGNLNFDGIGADKNLKINTKGKLNKFSIKDQILDNTTFDGLFSGNYIDALVKLDNPALKGWIDAKGPFSLEGKNKTFNLLAKGFIEKFTYQNKLLDGLSFDGNFSDEKIDANLNINNAMAKGTIAGIYFYKEVLKQVEFDAKLNYLNLSHYGITKEPNSQINGKASGKLSFTHLDDLLGNLHLTDFIYLSNNKALAFEQIDFGIEKIGKSQKKVFVSLPQTIEGYAQGDFILTQVPDIISNAFGKLYLKYKPQSVSKGQNFTFDFNLNNSFFDLFYPKLSIEPNTQISGSANTTTGDFSMNLSSEGINIDNINLGATHLNLSTQNPYLIQGEIEKLSTGKTLLENISISATPRGDLMDAMVNLDLTSGDFRSNLDLNLYQKFDAQNRMQIGFSKSEILIDNKPWQINQQNSVEGNFLLLDLKNKIFSIYDIALNREGQKLMVEGNYKSSENFNFDLHVEDLVLADLIPKGKKDGSQWKGLANGLIQINKTQYALEPNVDLQVKDVALDDYILGDLNLQSHFDKDKKAYKVESQLVDNQKLFDQEILNISGYIDNTKEKPEVDLVTHFEGFNMKMIQKFLGNSIQNFRGNLHGDINLDGPVSDLNYNGELALEDLGLTIPYTGVDYLFPGRNDLTLLKGNGGVFLLNGYPMTDTTFKTKGELDGSIFFKDLSTWGIDLTINSNNLLVLNSNPKLNESFYGRAFANGDFQITFDDLNGLDISGTSKISKGSEITVNMGASKTVAQSNLVKFIDFDNPQAEVLAQKPDELKGVELDFDLDLDTHTPVNLIFDPTSGDAIKALGKADHLKFRLNRAGDISLNGRYEIKDGEYQFRRVISKDFKLKNNSNIVFNGDPGKAGIDVTAAYNKTVSNVGEYLGNQQKINIDAELLLNLSGSLDDPELRFDIQTPGASEQIKQELATKFSAKEEVTNQFGAILTIGQFISQTDVSVNSTLSSGIEYGLNQLANIISNLNEDLKLNFEYTARNNLALNSDRIKTSVDYEVNPRVRVNGSIGVPLSGAYNETISGQFEAELDVTKDNDGDFLLRAFSRPTAFGVENFGATNSGYAQSFGAGMVYRKEFDRLDEIFKPKTEEEEKKP
ncbi:MAG: hypothetical protein C4K58_02145 [Flavobacteriaceae bacterium]|nr:MAG: hypothetical protein C4K58_02145 [Flavobacteriaceae bacterium]